MSELALKLESVLKTNKTSALDSFEKTLTEELVIGICAPIGSLKEKVIESLKYKLLTDYQYEEVRELKLSKFIEEYSFTEDDLSELPKVSEVSTAIYKSYFEKINKGNFIRKQYKNERLAEYAVRDIHLDRVKDAKKKKDYGSENPVSTDYESRRVCYIIDSLKTKEELLLFRKIYSENFFSISIFSSLDDRKYNLKNKGFTNSEIESIIEIDDKQVEKFGQNVRDVFVEGDLFIRVSKSNIPKIDEKISRFLHLVFETSIVTPTIEETAMYNAKAAAGNSACLSRQVGACIVDALNTVISIGWNDVPKFGGNLYSMNNPKDHRCFNHGFCSNDKQKSSVVDDIVNSILQDSQLEDVKKISDVENRLKNILLKNTKVKDLIEFSRSVHAEMHAIIQGAISTGDKLLNSKLFCTTYPCHNCARHIVASGIKEVYYIEPYVKSLCLTLHEDTMTERDDINDKVKLLIFDGISPNRYLSFFTNFAERKRDGILVKRDLKIAQPKTRKSLQALSTLEEQAVLVL